VQRYNIFNEFANILPFLFNPLNKIGPFLFNPLNKTPYIFSFASIYCCQARWELPPDKEFMP